MSEATSRIVQNFIEQYSPASPNSRQKFIDELTQVISAVGREIARVAWEEQCRWRKYA